MEHGRLITLMIGLLLGIAIGFGIAPKELVAQGGIQSRTMSGGVTCYTYGTALSCVAR